MKTSNMYRMLFIVLFGLSYESVQAFAFDMEEDVQEARLADVVGQYPKFDSIKNYFVTQLAEKAETLGAQPSNQDFIALYDAMPKDLKSALTHIYLNMPLSAQNEAIESLGYDAANLQAFIAAEIARRATRQVRKKVNKSVKDLHKWLYGK